MFISITLIISLERQRAEQAEKRTQLLADRLRAMGVDPDTL
ncbi:hypothetical protein [Nostoc commune]|nr:hypothetical protein [Nostoc commune]